MAAALRPRILAGVVRKKLKLKLLSKKVDDKRIYRISGGAKLDCALPKTPTA